jgi:hypothetical protein
MVWVNDSKGCMVIGSVAVRWALAMSAPVSVKAQKKGGLFFQPMGRLRGIPMSGLSLLLEGKTMASASAALGKRGTR